MGDRLPNTAGTSGDADGVGTWRETELRRLVSDISARLRKSCAHLPEEEFAKLVFDIAERRLRFDSMDPNRRAARRADE